MEGLGPFHFVCINESVRPINHQVDPRRSLPIYFIELRQQAISSFEIATHYLNDGTVKISQNMITHLSPDPP